MPVFPAFKSTWRSRRAFFAAAVIGAAAAIGVAGHAAPDAERADRWLALFLIGTGAAVVATATAASAKPWLVLAACVFLRVVALTGEPSLSDDRFRYVHEGRASRMGLSVPYALPPSDVTPPPDDGTTARVNHPDVPAAYPPFTQLFLLVTVAVGDLAGRPFGPLRVALVAVDLVLLAFLFSRRRPFGLAFARYGLHPLPLLDVALGAHLDGLGAALLAFAVLSSSGPFVRGVLVGLAMGVKPIAALGLLAVPKRAAPLRLAAAGAGVGFFVPALPYLVVGAPLFGGLAAYGARWEAAPTGYAVVEAIVGAPLARAEAEGRYTHLHVAETGGAGWLLETGGRPRLGPGVTRPGRLFLVGHGLVARLAAAGLLLVAVGVLIASAFRRRVRPPLVVASAIAALWLLAPTVHPWYLVWLLPLGAAVGSRALWAWGAAVPLYYEAALRYQATGVWEEAWWPRVVALTALVGGALLDLRALRSGDDGGASSAQGALEALGEGREREAGQ